VTFNSIPFAIAAGAFQERAMPDEREQKNEIENLQARMKRISSGRQSPKSARQEETRTTASTSTIRLDHSRLLKMQTDNSMVEQVALADVITARTQSNEREECLFRRPKRVAQVGEPPYTTHTLQFCVQNVKDLRHLADVISRMKESE
jgi:hypothetical protein